MPSPLTIVIFGASGDLTERKLIPALYHLSRNGTFREEARVVGVARTPMSDEAFRESLAASAKKHAGNGWDERAWGDFARRLHYVPADATRRDGLEKLASRLRELEGSEARRLYYLAVAPSLYRPIAVGLGEAGLAREEGGWRRLVIEKPFGHDLASARELNQALRGHFREEQLYRIDHYLGKETVQNILVFRFANTLFEPVWNHNYIDSVQITVSESGTVGDRVGYYDQAGVLRDMFQNHLLQLLALVAMEAPTRYAANALRNEKVKVLDAVSVPAFEEACGQVVAGQYEGYRGEKGVSPESRTPTYAALRLQVNNWRWQGVPFYLRSGKGLASRASEVIVQFRCPPHLMFPVPRDQVLACNRLALCIQPNEGIHLSFQAKEPAAGMRLSGAELEFHYRDRYPGVNIPEAYENLLRDALEGDAALFMRSDEIERAWEIMDPLIAAQERPDAPPPDVYPRGSQGPACADRFLEAEGRRWLSVCQH